MTDYTDIIRRLTEAEGPGRDLDWEVYASSGLEGVGMYGDHPEYTASLDASIALCEMMLPAMWGRKHEGANFDEEGWSYEVRVGADDGKYHLGIHDHEPIALLIAMFRALAQSKAGE